MLKRLAPIAGLLLVLAGCQSVAVRDYRELNNPKDIYEEGLKLIKTEDYSKAIEYFTYVLDTYNTPENEMYVSWAVYEIGFCYYRKGNDEKAVAYFDQVLTTAKTRSPRILASMLKDKIQKNLGYRNATYKGI